MINLRDRVLPFQAGAQQVKVRSDTGCLCNFKSGFVSVIPGMDE